MGFTGSQTNHIVVIFVPHFCEVKKSLAAGYMPVIALFLCSFSDPEKSAVRRHIRNFIVRFFVGDLRLTFAKFSYPSSCSWLKFKITIFVYFLIVSSIAV